MPTIYKRKSGSLRQQWDIENMEKAVEKVRNKEMGIRKAAREFHVPCSTLSRRVKSDKPNNSTALGPSSCFGKENERKLAAHLKKMSGAGFPQTRLKVRQLAYEFAERLGIPHKFNQGTRMAGYDWLNSFIRRNPDLSIRKSEGLSAARAKGLSRKKVQAFYDLLEEEVMKYGLMNKPQNIANCDESGIQLINSCGKVIAPKGCKAVHQVTTSERGETVTMLACCTAEGRFLPPSIILKGKNLKPEFRDGLPPGATIFMNQKSAYINTPLFLRWFEEVFVPRKAPGRNILILDGHCSHSFSIELLESADKNDVSLLCLPSHTTHVLQPLDKAFFGPFKSHFKIATGTWVNQNIGRKLTRYQLGPLVRTAWNKSATIGNGTSGFKSTGIFPFDRNVIPDHFFAISDSMQDAGENSLDEEQEELPPLQAKSRNPGRTSVSHRTFTDTERTDPENHSPTRVLHAITPVPVLSANNKTGRSEVGAVLLTSKSNREKLRINTMKKKEAQEKKSRSACKKRRMLNSDEKSSDDSDSDREEIPRRKQPVRKAKTKASKRALETTESVDPVDHCKECDNPFPAGDKNNLLRCNKCKAWLHTTCSIFDDSCFDCGRKTLQKR